MDSLIKYVIEMSFGIGKEMLEEKKQLIPQIIIVAENTIIPIIFTNPLQTASDFSELVLVVKSAWSSFLSEHPGVSPIAILSLSDMWMENIELGEYLKRRAAGTYKAPSQKPGSTEILMVQVASETENGTFVWPYVRGDGGIVFADEYQVRKEIGPILIKGLWPL